MMLYKKYLCQLVTLNTKKLITQIYSILIHANNVIKQKQHFQVYIVKFYKLEIPPDK